MNLFHHSLYSQYNNKYEVLIAGAKVQFLRSEGTKQNFIKYGFYSYNNYIVNGETYSLDMLANRDN